MINQIELTSTTSTMTVMTPSSILKSKKAPRERPIFLTLRMTSMGQEMTLRPTDKGRPNFSRTLWANQSLSQIFRGMRVVMSHQSLGRKLAKLNKT